MGPFHNRTDAGKILAKRILCYPQTAHSRPVIVALPRGGVPVAAALASTRHRCADVLVDDVLLAHGGRQAWLQVKQHVGQTPLTGEIAGSLQVAIRMEQNGRLDEAIRYLENSIAKSPDAPSLYNRLAIILMRERADLRRAEQLLQKATELAPGHEVYEKNLAAVLAKRAMKK